MEKIIEFFWERNGFLRNFDFRPTMLWLGKVRLGREI